MEDRPGLSSLNSPILGGTKPNEIELGDSLQLPGSAVHVLVYCLSAKRTGIRGLEVDANLAEGEMDAAHNPCAGVDCLFGNDDESQDDESQKPDRDKNIAQDKSKEPSRETEVNNEGQKAPEAPKAPSLSNDGEEGEAETAKPRPTLLFCHFVLMGGLAVDVSEIHDSVRRVTLTANGVTELSKRGHLPFIPDKRIQELDHFDYLGNGIAIFQAFWLVLECIGRRAAGLPIALLELNTCVNIGFALCLRLLWHAKPFNLESPIVVNDSNFKGCIALMFMVSDISGIGRRRSWGLWLDRPESNHIATYLPTRNSELKSPDCHSAENPGSKGPISSLQTNASLRRPSSENLDISGNHRLSGAPAPSSNNHSREYSYENTNSDASSKDLTIERPSIMTMSEPLGVVTKQVHKVPKDVTIIGIMQPGECFNSGVGIHPSARMSYEVSAKDALRWRLAESERKVLERDRSFDLTPDERIGWVDWDRFLSRFNPVVNRGLNLDMTFWNLVDMKVYFETMEYPTLRWMGAFLTLHGGVHLSAWTFNFPTQLELLLWKVSCFTLCGWVWAMGLVVYMNYAVLGPNLRRDSKLKFIAEVTVKFLTLTSVALAIAVSASSIYLILEAFLSLRHEPVGVFARLEWTAFFPILG
ncbi:uncharacterized protein KY384_006651 [Bacidia gigantensis]|uniref:uncharacterized protein n=1 Tax=Bacidia gigantensis TaxID=2732470 RepID=UPI001D049BFE|nr:uncharacterized protein KY384_006651 [Bacidia gigantensis]KAG8528962.1 hypothetical protein KY384_006651 [Bacidia gigantensis]